MKIMLSLVVALWFSLVNLTAGFGAEAHDGAPVRRLRAQRGTWPV